jgi:hypothetical protein
MELLPFLCQECAEDDIPAILNKQDMRSDEAESAEEFFVGGA